MKLNIKVAENPARLIEMLEAGEVDVVAYPIPINNKLKQEVIYCGREDISSQVLIQRANKGDKLLTDVTQLIDKNVYVKPNTKYSERLKNLDEELGGGIHIQKVENDSIATEDLIEMVSLGEIPYTISDDNTARLNKTYYWNINVDLKVSFPQRSSWGVRKSSPDLAKAIDEWASDKTGKHSFKAVTKRYFELSKQPFTADIPEVKNGHISPYDPLFKKHAKNIGWDWQLLASISYQESHFNPTVVKFTLAAYNAGIGHIYDAQRLARKYGKDPNKWDNNVAEYIRLKNDPEYYNDPVCKHGYLRGSETYNYVREVLERYHYYKKKS